MQRILKSFILLFLVISLNSCIGFSSKDIFTELKDPKAVNCQNLPENVELYFDSETILFSYEKIGLIEVQGDGYLNDKEILEKLKKLAKSKCCDAIIGIKKNYISRESGLLFTDQHTNEYKTISYNGIAVKKI
jgi:hypothetical protein